MVDALIEDREIRPPTILHALINSIETPQKKIGVVASELASFAFDNRIGIATQRFKFLRVANIFLHVEGLLDGQPVELPYFSFFYIGHPFPQFTEVLFEDDQFALVCLSCGFQ